MPIRLLIVIVVLLSSSGCFFKSDLKKCHKSQEYQQTKPGPRVRVPDDLKSLPPESRLDVPFGEVQTEPLPKDQPCLTEPPVYAQPGKN
jgi:uncharacterized lipoprotein